MYLSTLVILLATATEVKSDPAAIEFFEKKVRPVLVQHCYECHSGTAKKLKASLRLDSRANMLHGGDQGPAIVPGKPDESLLVTAISYKDGLRMPPRSKLSGEQIADLTKWVQMGAPWPGGEKGTVLENKFDFEKLRKHWSFQYRQNISPPDVKASEWARNGIDRFILAKIEAKNLTPARQAERRTLIRRVTFDLTGLPPTPQEVEAFVKDSSPDAYERLVDRLLTSQAYGERWGRHWLDLMRFAETSGHEFDFEIPLAHKYRDAIIRALNEDVPYARLVREHVAGDLMDDPRREQLDRTNESILMTGFWFLGESKHSPVDLRVDGGDRRDNMVDVFAKTFLGLTVSCARCHDHKFDPIYTKDYYSLVSFIQSSRQQLAFIDHPERVSDPARKAREARQAADRQAVKLAAAQLVEKGARLASSTPEFAKELAKSNEELFRPWRVLSDPALKTPEAWQAKRKELLGQLQAQAKQTQDRGKDWRALDNFRGKEWTGWFSTGDSFGLSPAQSHDVEVHDAKVTRIKRGAVSGRKTEGALRSKTFTIEKKHILYKHRGQAVRVNLIIDNFQQIRDPIYGGLTFVLNSPQSRWHAQNVSMWVGLKAYIEILDDGDGWCELEEVVFSDHAAPPPVAPSGELTKLIEGAKSLDDLAKGYSTLVRSLATAWAGGELTSEQTSLIDQTLSSPLLALLPVSEPMKDDSDLLLRLSATADQLEAGLAKPRRGLAIADGDGNDERIHIRGNPRTLGENAPRRLPVVLAGEEQPAGKYSGRSAMAQRLSSPDNPLVARVIVNRLWHHHFGAGIVRSVDDFGHQGERPTHPELLDWLSNELVRKGWSLKELHRLIVLSATYQQSSRSDEDSDRIDPKNELLHKMPIRRLEAEAVRDALLAISGRLDRRMYGPGPLPNLTEFMIGRGRPGSGPLDGEGRRSLYLNVRRNFLNPMFLAFDYPVPFTTMGRRGVSNVPAQALAMLNNPFVLSQSRLFAERTQTIKDEDAGIAAMYELAFGRSATIEEIADAKAFLREQGKEYGAVDGRAWADLGHVLVNVKEFIFVN